MFGISFVMIVSTFITLIYYMYPINNITSFLKPISRSTYNSINTTILPVLIWNIFLIPIIGTNVMFIPAIVFNILISMLVMYIVKTAFYIIANKEHVVFDVIAVVAASFAGQFAGYLMYLVSSNDINIFINIFLQFIKFFLIL